MVWSYLRLGWHSVRVLPLWADPFLYTIIHNHGGQNVPRGVPLVEKQLAAIKLDLALGISQSAQEHDKRMRFYREHPGLVEELLRKPQRDLADMSELRLALKATRR